MPNKALMVGESLVGDGNEVAHVDVMVGPKDGPAGYAFANALSSQREGHNTLLAIVAPNLPCKPDTILFNKVTIKGAKQAVQMFGPAQAAVARAVADSVEAGIVPGDDNLCILVGVFIHWDADDDEKIFDFNYRATRESLQRAMRGEPAAQTVTSRKAGVTHPFASGSEKQLEKAEFQREPR
jgi:5,6,7,8-tetrahydromethanopterin hydro-lyase